MAGLTSGRVAASSFGDLGVTFGSYWWVGRVSNRGIRYGVPWMVAMLLARRLTCLFCRKDSCRSFFDRAQAVAAASLRGRELDRAVWIECFELMPEMGS